MDYFAEPFLVQRFGESNEEVSMHRLWMDL